MFDACCQLSPQPQLIYFPPDYIIYLNC
jgi:hypothetical protein